MELTVIQNMIYEIRGVRVMLDFDLSEDVRKEIDNIYQAIAELSIKPVAPEKPVRKIGYKTQND